MSVSPSVSRGFRTPSWRLYAAAARRSLLRYGVRPWRLLAPIDERMVFVVGSPRSGTSFTASALGNCRGFADLGELNPLKASIDELAELPLEDAARHVRSIVVRSQRLGCVAGYRCIEQTPESTFVIPAIALAFPAARFLHLVRDGRDVACSLIERGWLRATGTAVTGGTHDDAGQPFGAHARSWVEPERREEFAAASEATRAAWAWRSYERAARTALAGLPDGRALEVRYEQLVTDPAHVAFRIATFLDAMGAVDDIVRQLATAHAASVGRWQRDLDADQQRQIVAEAGALLSELGYHSPAIPQRG